MTLTADNSKKAPEPRAFELALAVMIALAAGALYALTFQTRYYGDGGGLASLHVLGTGGAYNHVLYLPLCDLLQHALGIRDPFFTPRLVSVLPAALGLGATYLVLRRCATPVFGALVATGLMALSPSLWFFATTVEVHAVLFGVVALVAAVTLFAPWHKPASAVLLVALTFPLLFLAHQSAFVLGPGWVLLVQFARSRRGSSFAWRSLLLGVGPLLLATLLAAAFVAGWARSGSPAGLVIELAHRLDFETGLDAAHSSQAEVWRDEWLLPLGVLFPLALAGAPRLRAVAWRTPAIAMLVAVPTAFFLWWGVCERGGYFLGQAPFLLVPVALLFGHWTRGKMVLALGLLALQGTWAFHQLQTFDQGWDPDQRAAQARAALGEGGLLVTTTPGAPRIESQVPGLEELSLNHLVGAACIREQRLITPEEIVALARPLLAGLLEQHGHAAVELGFARMAREDPSIAMFTPQLAALEALLREQYVMSELYHPYWTILVLEQER